MMTPERRRRGGREFALVCEAGAHLIVARGALLVVPFRRIAAWTTRAVPARRLSEPQRRRAIDDVRWAVAAAAARLPGMRCLARALAAQEMLRRRGMVSALTYGARPRGTALDAHVWLTAESEGIVGCETASEYG